MAINNLLIIQYIYLSSNYQINNDYYINHQLLY